MTLSHCWGTHSTLRLLLSNIADFKIAIPLEDLSKVYQNALMVTARIGFHYLWIDSLCIIQDNIGDWRAEAANMGEIYRNGVCNIAATGFKDGASGLFVNRNTKRMLPLTITLFTNVALHGKIVVPRGPYILVDGDFLKRNIEQAPLNRRAWVVQERLLSPRTLHFGSQQVFYECIQRIYSEIYVSGFPDGMNDLPAKLNLWSLENGTQRPQERDDSWSLTSRLRTPLTLYERLHMTWGAIVGSYTMGSLTVKEDKLIAVAGLAKSIHQHIRCTYFAGLWEDRFLDQLLWAVASSLSNGAHLPLNAPSWTWASTTAPVWIPLYPLELDKTVPIMLATLDNVSVTLVHGDQFGLIEEGHVLITGNLGMMFTTSSKWGLRDQSILTAALEGIEVTKIDFDLWFHHNRPSHGICHLVREVRNKIEPLIQHSNLFFIMPIKTGRHIVVDNPEVYGLLLEPVLNSKGTFRKIGIFLTDYKGIPANILSLFQVSTLTEDVPDQYHLGRGSKGRYTIKII